MAELIIRCFACPHDPFSKQRQVAVQNAYGDYACDRHVGDLWTLTARNKANGKRRRVKL